MSRHHSRTQRASAYSQARKRSRTLGGTTGNLKDELADIELAAAKWRALAPKLGFCSGCGAIVDEAAGKLHDEHCLPGAPERCKKGQVT